MNKTEKQTKTIKAGVRMDEETTPFPVVASVKQLVNYRIFLYGETSSAFDFVEAINAIDYSLVKSKILRIVHYLLFVLGLS